VETSTRSAVESAGPRVLDGRAVRAAARPADRSHARTRGRRAAGPAGGDEGGGRPWPTRQSGTRRQRARRLS
jgi:hypothetical protein